MKQYRKGLTAVVDRCVYISYNRYHSVPKSLICCCSGRDSCMLTSRCMLPLLRSAPYPALCPCEPPRPVGEMKAVSCGARSRQYSPLLPASSSLPRSIVEGPRSAPMGRVHINIYTFILARCSLSALESFFGHFSAARPRLVARLAPSDSSQPRGPCPRAGPPSPPLYAQR